MSRTLTSPRRQASSRTCRSSFPSASRATSLGRRNPRRRNLGGFIVAYCRTGLADNQDVVNRDLAPALFSCAALFLGSRFLPGRPLFRRRQRGSWTRL